MAIRDMVSRPPTAVYEAGFEVAFPGKSHGKHLDRHCNVCGRIPRWCECLDMLAKIPDLDRARGATQPEAPRKLKSPGQARWPMVVVK